LKPAQIGSAVLISSPDGSTSATAGIVDNGNVIRVLDLVSSGGITAPVGTKYQI
jgi:hypothetical protein